MMEILYSVLRNGSSPTNYYYSPRVSPPPPTIGYCSNTQFVGYSEVPCKRLKYSPDEFRFPTPPITPPTIVIHSGSVPLDAMKVGQGQQIISSHEIEIEHEIENASSESSTPSSEHVCQWFDCNRFFDSLSSLAGHVNQLHAVPLDDGLYYCRWKGCQRSARGFNARYKMLVHVRTHTKEKPHSCHLCKKSFSRAENLKIHIRSHSGEKPYVCTYDGCNKAYSNSSDRFKHTRTHAVEKPYVCKVPGCQKRYTDPSSLRKHVKTFKHGEQLVDSDRLKAATNYRETYSASPTNPTSMHSYHDHHNHHHHHHHDHHRPLSSYEVYNYSPPTVSQLYMPAEVADVEAKQLDDYYYEAEHAKRAYWPHGSCLTLGYSDTYGVNVPLSSLAIQTPLDLPLDLRTNRK